MGKSTPILLLGVAGLGLSLAMFFDTKNTKIPKAVQETVEEDPVTEVIDVVEMTDEEQEEMKQEIKDELKQEIRRDYKQLYREKKREENRPRIIADHRYKGNGSRFDKKLYFAQQAYRRSREVVPVDANIALAVKLSKELDELEKNEDFEDVLSDSDVEETLEEITEESEREIPQGINGKTTSGAQAMAENRADNRKDREELLNLN